MKKQILNLGKALSRVEQKNVFGGTLGPCRDAYPAQGNGCKCNKDNQCASGKCSGGASGSKWFKECIAKVE